MSDEPHPADFSVTRRSMFGAFAGAMAFGASAAARGADAAPSTEVANVKTTKRYNFKKSINQWAFPYPQKMSLEQCLLQSTSKEYIAIRKLCDQIGIAISGLCSFLFWPYPMTSSDGAKRARSLELASLMTRAAHDLGVENLLVVPGAVHIPWRDDYEPVPNDVCDRRAREAIGRLLPEAEKLGVSLNIENIFFNGYLMSPGEMIDFVDSFGSDRVKVHFDTGNIMMFQFPEHWIAQLGGRIKNVHFKEFTKKGTDYSLESFRPLLDGTTNWPAVLEQLAATDYDGYLTFEYFHPYQHWPEALVYQTADSLDRMLGRK